MLPALVPSDHRTWLVSSGRDDMIADVNCVGSGSLPSRRFSMLIPSVGLIQVPTHCRFSMQGRNIHSPYESAGSSFEEVHEILDRLDLGISEAIVNNLTVDIPFLKDIHVQRFSRPPINDDTLFANDIIEISQVNTKMRSDNKLYANTIDKMSAQLSEDEKAFNMSLSGVTSYFKSFSWPSLVVPVPSLYNICVLIWLIALTYHILKPRTTFSPAGAAMALLPESLMKHQSFAAVITATNVTQPILDTLRQNPSKQSGGSLLMWVPVICLIVMVIFHIHIVTTLSTTRTKLANQLGWVPVNKNTVQHVGENKIIMGILLKFTTICGQRVIRRQSVIQVATLPGRPNSWYIKDQRTVPEGSITGKFNRWSKYAVFSINWKNICIRSKDFEEIDTCQELPPLIKIKSADMYCHTKSHLPWLWWSAEAETVTSISISQNTDSDRIYDYTKMV